MVIRRIIASFFVFLLVTITVPTFLVFALSKTYFSGAFYGQAFATGSYEFIVDAASKNLYETDPILRRSFKLNDLQTEIRQVFTPALYRSFMTDFGSQIEKLKARPGESATVSLKVFRESLLTVTHNLAYRLFKSLPTCKTDQLPEVNQEGIPTCVPKGIDYASVSASIGKKFEKVIYEAVPEQVEIDLSSSKNPGNQAFYYIFAFIEPLKIYLLAALLAITGVIALAMYKPISKMMYFEATAFMSSGFSGFLLSIGLQWLPRTVITTLSSTLPQNAVGGDQASLQRFMDFILSFMVGEIQKLSLIFFVLGAILMIVYFFLRKKVEA